MSHLQNRARIMLISLVVGILILVGLSGAHDLSKEKFPTQTNIPRINNHTNGLTVSSASVSQEPFPQFKLSVVNQSSRNINGYVLTIGNLSITTDFASIGEVMEPGASRDEIIPLSNFDAAASEGPRLERELTIAAISFEGLSGEGDSPALKMLLERHRGIRDQLDIVLSNLRGMRERSSSPTIPDELERVAATLSTEVDRVNLYPALSDGRRWISEQFRKQLRESKGRANIDDMIAFYEQLLSRI